MNKVKTNLFALAAGVLISPALMAADINSQTGRYGWSDEALGLAGATDVVTSGALVLVMNAEYQVGDLITFTFSGGALDPDSVPTSASAPCTDGGLVAGVTLGFLSATADEAQFRVTEITTTAPTTSCANTTVGRDITIAGEGVLEFDPAAVAAAGGVTVGFSARTAGTGGIPIDTGSGPAVGGECEFSCNARTTGYIQTGPYFGASVSPRFNATIDVNQERKVLLDPDNFGPGAIPDMGGFSATLNPIPGTFPVTVAFVDHDVIFTGNFGWIIDNGAADGIQPIDGVVNIVGGCGDPATWEVTATTISATCTDPFARLELNPDLNRDGAGLAGLRVLSATSFTAETVINYADTWWENDAVGTLPVGPVGIGAWDLNGYQALVPYMPYGSNISQIIYLANRGAQTGAVTVDWIDANGNGDTLTDITTIGPNSTKSLGNIIRNNLPAAQRASGRLALVITVNIPSEDGQLNAQYNVSGNRAYVLHEDNRGVVLRDSESRFNDF